MKIDIGKSIARTHANLRREYRSIVHGSMLWFITFAAAFAAAEVVKGAISSKAQISLIAGVVAYQAMRMGLEGPVSTAVEMNALRAQNEETDQTDQTDQNDQTDQTDRYWGSVGKLCNWIQWRRQTAIHGIIGLSFAGIFWIFPTLGQPGLDVTDALAVATLLWIIARFSPANLRSADAEESAQESLLWSWRKTKGKELEILLTLSAPVALTAATVLTIVLVSGAVLHFWSGADPDFIWWAQIVIAALAASLYTFPAIFTAKAVIYSVLSQEDGEDTQR